MIVVHPAVASRSEYFFSLWILEFAPGLVFNAAHVQTLRLV